MSRSVPASELSTPRIGHRLKRWLFLVHRWIGIFTCLLFAIWLLSGLVMIYVPFPSLDKAERLTGLSPIDWHLVRITPETARQRAGPGQLKTLSLEMGDSQPVWRVMPWEGEAVHLSAVTGRPLAPTDAPAAAQIAGTFGHAPVGSVTSIERDQWTVAGGFDRHRPLWKVALEGPGGRVLYVSSRSGEVVFDTNAHERFWNWLGSVPHWIYPTILRQNNLAWRQVVMWVSGPCILGAVAGIWIGILRVRIGRRRFGPRRVTPYRGWMKWHHVAGLVGGLFLTTWIFSGWLSVDPGRFFQTPGIGQAAMVRYAGVDQPLLLSMTDLARAGAGARRLRIRWVFGAPQILVERDPLSSTLLDGESLSPLHIDRQSILDAAAHAMPRAHIVAIDRLTAPDAYWYETNSLPLLPVLRIRYDDPARSWIYVDPASGSIVGETDARRRLYRWLFDLLHKWDLNGLIQTRPSWDLLLWLLSVLALTVAVSGVVIGWRRLRRALAF
jgi:uncharacterized iron-regulated membrane protein